MMPQTLIIKMKVDAAMNTQTKQAKHTALPWELSEYRNGFKLEIIADDGIVATVAGTSGTSEETEANAKLIVNAVNSHEELLAFAQMIANGGLDAESHETIEAEARQLIAHATGE